MEGTGGEFNSHIGEKEFGFALHSRFKGEDSSEGPLGPSTAYVRLSSGTEVEDPGCLFGSLTLGWKNIYVGGPKSFHFIPRVTL